jgi:hypothetical protein
MDNKSNIGYNKGNNRPNNSGHNNAFCGSKGSNGSDNTLGSPV